MAYICDDCGQPFDELAEWEEPRGEYAGSVAYEKMDGSPCCHAGFTDAVKCAGCGEWVDKYSAVSGFCKPCTADVFKRYRCVMEEFTKDERKLLSEIFEGSDPFAS